MPLTADELGAGEDDVAADPAPHHMRFSRMDRVPILEGRPAVRCPSHLKDPRSPFNPFDPEARTETLTAPEVLDELLHGPSEALPVGGAELRVIV
jgi:hypothetical protein